MSAETCFLQLQSGALPTELSEASLPKCHHYLILINDLQLSSLQQMCNFRLSIAFLTLTLTKVEDRLTTQEFERVNSLIKSADFDLQQWSRLSMVRVASPNRMGEHGE